MKQESTDWRCSRKHSANIIALATVIVLSGLALAFFLASFPFPRCIQCTTNTATEKQFCSSLSLSLSLSLFQTQLQTIMALLRRAQWTEGLEKNERTNE